MVTCSDPAYQATRQIKAGRASLAPPFAELAAWIAARWHVTVLNVLYDQVELLHGRPRLQVIFEHSRERRTFLDGPNFDATKQRAIAERFAQLVTDHTPARFSLDGLFVVFAAFAPLARVEADERITERDVQNLQRRLADEELWTIHRCFGLVTFMFYTHAQARSHEEAGLRDAYSDMYFDMLRSHDEFGYLSRPRFSVKFDSKENFDENYQGSWFFYDR